MYALVQILGKQYKAEAGSRLKIDRLAKAPGEGGGLSKPATGMDSTKAPVALLPA